MSARAPGNPALDSRNKRIRGAITRLNPRNPFDDKRAEGKVTLMRRWHEDTAEPSWTGAFWTKRYEASLSALQEHEIAMLKEVGKLNIERVAKYAEIKEVTRRAPGTTRFHANNSPEQEIEIVMPDYGLDLDAWKLLLPYSKNRASLHVAFALSCVRAIWRALLAMRSAGKSGMVHGDLKLDNISIPIVPGSLKLGADRRTVRLQLDVDQLRLIDLQWALSSEPTKRAPTTIDGRYDRYPRGDYVSKILADAYVAADPTLTNGRNPSLLQDLDWRADIFSLAVLIEKWAKEIESKNDRQKSATALYVLKELARTFRQMHDDNDNKLSRAAQVIRLIDSTLIGPDEWQKVDVEFNLLELADQNKSLADIYADLIAPPPSFGKPVNPRIPWTVKPISPWRAAASIGVVLLALGAGVYLDLRASHVTEPPVEPLRATPHADRVPDKMKKEEAPIAEADKRSTAAEQAWRDASAKDAPRLPAKDVAAEKKREEAPRKIVEVDESRKAAEPARRDESAEEVRRSRAVDIAAKKCPHSAQLADLSGVRIRVEYKSNPNDDLLAGRAVRRMLTNLNLRPVEYGESADLAVTVGVHVDHSDTIGNRHANANLMLNWRVADSNVPCFNLGGTGVGVGPTRDAATERAIDVATSEVRRQLSR